MIRLLTILSILNACVDNSQQTQSDRRIRISKTTDSANAVPEDETAIPPSNVTGSFLTCIPAGDNAVGCNVMHRSSEKSKPKRVKVSLWAEEIDWSYQSENSDDTIMIDTDSQIHHAVYYFEKSSKQRDATRIKLELNDFVGTKAPSDYVLSAPLQHLRPNSKNLPSGGTIIKDAYLDIFVDNETGEFGTTPKSNAKKVQMPTVNNYLSPDGCYVACYTNDKDNWVYAVSDDIGVMGMFRTQGFYEAGGRVCRPKGFEDADISALDSFKDLCSKSLENCAGRTCWAGGDTRGFLYE